MGFFNQTSETYNTAYSQLSAFAGGTTNARGDDGGTGDPKTLFTVTGMVAIKIVGRCTVNLASAGGGTVAVGTIISPTGLITTTTATDIDAGEIWHDATPDASVEATTVMAEKIVNQDIIETIATADITAGNIEYVCLWRALTPNANVVAATS